MKAKPEDYAVLVLRVLRFILKHVGKDSAVTAEVIENALGIEPRVIADIASFLGRHGYMVCSGSEGYYYAGTEEEWNAHLEKERQRAIALLIKVSEAKKNRVDQFTLFEQKPAA